MYCWLQTCKCKHNKKQTKEFATLLSTEDNTIKQVLNNLFQYFEESQGLSPKSTFCNNSIALCSKTFNLDVLRILQNMDDPKIHSFCLF